ncbi:tricarballylate utilization 4Fe-4S protein TcuB [Martelella mediterranea]|uniref:Tricarballylate utilization protein B n=1 Tax=Martelella mediterranea DSM 17316 TaxID=1122214 RepID=A0A1U9Z884_9HYPH|nr:tricarballylate utilization 4Fe-4S protein TcuB [Martelella mediterranea]AQZ53898.1 tricarballylate utilization protein B [Martelella mediterranea DSM 17316]
MSHETPALTEADRLMTVCNSCRYCEGLCAVFPAMEMKRSFSDGDLNHLANLCHGCGACFHDCQFSPPHEFNVNVPKVLAQVRTESYAHYAWPAAARPLFARHGLALALGLTVSFALFLLGIVAANNPGALWTAHLEDSRFYALMPHNAMVALFGAAFLYMLFAIFMGARAFWRDAGAPDLHVGDHLEASVNAAKLTYLDGGGQGCFNEDDKPTDRRRLWHHFTFYGFLLCLASTSLATLYHYLLGREAPYAWYDIPALLGIAGGIGLVIGPIGLIHAKLTRHEALRTPGFKSMEYGFIVILLVTGATGLALRLLGETPLLGLLLALHLGAVLTFFLTMPYGKFVHGLYRYLALIRYARDKREIGLG